MTLLSPDSPEAGAPVLNATQFDGLRQVFRGELIKAVYDPTNLFRLNANNSPA
jgi:hypothetical protein